MHHHAPSEYICPICLGVKGIENEQTLLKQADLVYRDELVSAFINSFWVGTNEGHAIVVPNDHVENIYDLPNSVGGRIFAVSRLIAKGMKKMYQCDGITIRQNNEPASEQHAFHYHLHVFPRYADDDFNLHANKKSWLSEPSDRIKYARKLRDYCLTHSLSKTKPEFTGVCALIFNQQGQLLVGKRLNSYGAGKDGLPGGRLQLHEPLLDGIFREIKEETGLIISNLKFVGVVRETQVGCDYIHFIYAATNITDQPQLCEPNKCESWRWIDPESTDNNLLSGHQLALKLYRQQQAIIDIENTQE